MRRDARPGRTAPLTIRRSVQLLACEFSIASDCALVVSALDGFVQHATQHVAPSRSYTFEARRTGESYRLRADGNDMPPAPDAQSAAEALFWRMHDLALEAMADHTKLHAGCATIGGRRLLVVGPATAGKSTFMTRLLYDGHAVHCDDMVLLRGAEVVPFPRRFRIRPAAVPLLPQVAAIADRLPRDRECLALDPAEEGFAWHITRAAVDVLVYLDGGDRSRVTMDPCPKHVMATHLMAQSNLPAGGRRTWVRDICGLLDRADAYVLFSGDLNNMVAALARVAGDQSAESSHE